MPRLGAYRTLFPEKYFEAIGEVDSLRKIEQRYNLKCSSLE